MFAIFTVLAMPLTGCVTSYGNNNVSNKEVIAQLEIGKSTKTDVEQMFGEPGNVVFGEDGQEQWHYTQGDHDMTKQQAASGALSFLVPFGGYASSALGSKAEHHSLTIVFDNDGIVRKVGKGKQETTTGIVNL